jgi:hypothetical protein
LKGHLPVVLQHCGFIFENGEIMMDKIFNSITLPGHRELATHKQRPTLHRLRGDRQMEMSAPTVRRPPALFGEWVVQMGLGDVYER